MNTILNNEYIENYLLELGLDVCESTKSSVTFIFKGNFITYYIKKQWSTGKGIKDCRGWENLIKQINPASVKNYIVNGVDCSSVSNANCLIYIVNNGKLVVKNITK